ncbi:MAG: hypothetical protein Q9157_002767 [Trypethelium eluteriae]
MDTARYTIGWIAPLPLELTAARAMFDDDYHDIPVGNYTYYGGKIREHYVVMAVQPRMGTDAASDLVARMRSAFQSLKCFLVVGIGGGVRGYGPHGATSQIVLGDVVVSVPMSKHGGVVRYDAGAWTGEGTLETKGHTNSPPSFLLHAVASLRSKHTMSPGTNISAFLEQMRNRLNTNEQVKFADQGSDNDWLFRDDFPHPPDSRDKSCDDVCDRGQSQSRQDRGEEAMRGLDAPRIHYGNIGSSNQLQISATKRNQCQKEHGVICFEMEGAGVIQTHPCLVIRGICDYADSHKNKKWQPYAAATAAAYAKELLYEIPASQVSLATGNINEYGKSINHEFLVN